MKCKAQKSCKQRAAASCPTARQNLSLTPMYQTVHLYIEAFCRQQGKPRDAAFGKGTDHAFMLTHHQQTLLRNNQQVFLLPPQRKPRKGARRGEIGRCTEYVLGSSGEGILIPPAPEPTVLSSLWHLKKTKSSQPTHSPHSFLEEMCVMC